MTTSLFSCALDGHTARRGALLREALAPFVEELRLVDCAELVAHVTRGQFANLDDIVQSSLELFYAPGAFAFGWGAEIDMAWHAPPVLKLGMEFSGGGMTAFFVLRIAADTHDIEIRCISSDVPGADPDTNTDRLAGALYAARQGSDKTARAR